MTAHIAAQDLLPVTSFLESLGCVFVVVPIDFEDSLHCELKGRGGVIGPLHHEPPLHVTIRPKVRHEERHDHNGAKLRASFLGA
jgi:hypothetical protein